MVEVDGVVTESSREGSGGLRREASRRRERSRIVTRSGKDKLIRAIGASLRGFFTKSVRKPVVIRGLKLLVLQVYAHTLSSRPWSSINNASAVLPLCSVFYRYFPLFPNDVGDTAIIDEAKGA